MSLFAQAEAEGGSAWHVCEGEVFGLFFFFEEGAKLGAMSTVTGKTL